MCEKFVNVNEIINREIYKITYLNGNIVDMLSKIIENPKLFIHVDTTAEAAYYYPKLDTININIHFMSFMWMFCYVAFYSMEKNNEDQMSPDQISKYGRLLDLNNPKIKSNYDIISAEIFAILNKRKSFNQINEALIPDEINLQNISNDYDEFIGKVNAIYVRAIAFILFHEFGHKNLNHIYTSVQQSLKNEEEADSYAIKSMFSIEKKLDDITLLNDAYGMISGFLSLFFISSYNSIIFDNDHPSLVKRVLLIVNEISRINPNFTELDYLLQYCCSVFSTSLIACDITINNFNAGDDIREYFSYLYKEAYSYRALFFLRDFVKKSSVFYLDDFEKKSKVPLIFTCICNKKFYLQMGTDFVIDENRDYKIICIKDDYLLDITARLKSDDREENSKESRVFYIDKANIKIINNSEEINQILLC